VLIDAMEHPENYTDLVVRVSGFSAFYITLNREVQLDILNRTQQE
jgi:formate C-acetyltransferase